MDSIFVAIAAYRDPELVPTIRDLFAKANHPERIVVGACYQSVPSVDDGLLAPVPYPANVHLESWNASDSKGAVWAKGRAHKLRRGEAFTLMCDSHCRFTAGFDTALVAMLDECGSAKPVLSTYPAPYHPANGRDRERLDYSTPHLVANDFGDERVGRLLAQERKMTKPMRNAFVSGGYVFARSSLFDEVPLDPKTWFLGEEISQSLRLWTHGWDAYSPSQCLVHHYYARKKEARVWNDDPEWWKRNNLSLARVRHLCGTETSTDPEVIDGLDGIYGLGDARSVADFEIFSGMNFRALNVSDNAKRGVYGV